MADNGYKNRVPPPIQRHVYVRIPVDLAELFEQFLNDNRYRSAAEAATYLLDLGLHAFYEHHIIKAWKMPPKVPHEK